MSTKFWPLIFLGMSCSVLTVGATTSSCSSELRSFIVKFSIPCGLLYFKPGGLRSKISGISISVSLVRVKLDFPTIPWTTSTPKSISSLENIILGSITVIWDWMVFKIPHLGCILISALKTPVYFELKRTLNFLVSSGLILIFSVISSTLPVICKTMGYLDTFFISIISSNLWPAHKMGLGVVRGFTVNLGSCRTQVHNTVTSGPSKTFKISLYVKLY